MFYAAEFEAYDLWGFTRFSDNVLWDTDLLVRFNITHNGGTICFQETTMPIIFWYHNIFWSEFILQLFIENFYIKERTLHSHCSVKHLLFSFLGLKFKCLHFFQHHDCHRLFCNTLAWWIPAGPLSFSTQVEGNRRKTSAWVKKVLLRKHHFIHDIKPLKASQGRWSQRRDIEG